MDDVRIIDLDAPRPGPGRLRLAVLVAIAAALPLTSGTWSGRAGDPAPSRVQRSALSQAVTEAYANRGGRSADAAKRDRAFTGWAAH